MQTEQIKQLAVDALEALKAVDVVVLDVRGMTTITDYMIVASANSNRHLKALADNVIEAAKVAGHRPLGIEGETGGEWALVDLGDVVIHIMMPAIREFYQIEKLWSVDNSAAVEGEAP
jgi:ribosome-associated protein